MNWPKSRIQTLFFYTFAIIASSYIVFSCASVGTPSGGAYDLDPPKVVKSTPSFNALNISKGKVEIIFDELVQIENPNEKVIITPPQRRLPSIQAISNKVTVELKDSLLPNTTYTIDFTDAIADYNEKNAIENFSISFSTGDHLDSLIISGKVLEAESLELVSGIYVGLHSNLADSAFTKVPFERISRTNDKGEFSIRGVAEGEYHIYALKDANRDFMYDSPQEAIAFLDKIIIPSAEEGVHNDTIYNAKDSTLIDSIKTVTHTHFLPDDILLRSFTSDFKRQYLQKSERPSDDVIQIFFGAPTAMPKLEPLNFNPKAEWALLEKTATNDTLIYWITDKNVVNTDTLSFKITYLKTDSLNNAVDVTDTLNIINRNKRQNKKDKDKTIKFVNIESNMRQTLDVYSKAYITFEKPVYDFSKDKLSFLQLIDTTFVSQPFEVQQDSLNPRKYEIVYKWQPGGEYSLSADSAAFHSYDSLWTDKVAYKFKVKTLDQYANLALLIDGLKDEEHAFVELLDQSDKPFRKAIVKNNEAIFPNVAPGKYYARIILDENNNGKWDTGDYKTKQQPELVFYCNRFFELKANWDAEEPWNIYGLPLDKQKPLEITKNKPKEKESKRKQLEKEDAKNKEQQGARSSSNDTRIRGLEN